MVDSSRNIDFDNDDQIRLLTNLREDIRILLEVHPKGIWFRMLPKVFYMHFHRDIHLDFFAIPNPILFLDYISDMIKFDLPDNLHEEDFIIELKIEGKEMVNSPIRAKDLKTKREMLLMLLQNANLEDRGAFLREICITDGHLKQSNEEEPIVPPPAVPTGEQLALRLQKIRSMIDVSLRYLLQSSHDIPDQELIQLYQNTEEFICHLTPIAQRLSSSIS